MNRWTSAIGAQLVLTLPLIVPAASVADAGQPPPAEPLDAHVVDTASYPTVLIDLVVPWQFRTTDIEPAMIELEGGTIDSAAPVEAIGSVVGLVIDDGPTVPVDVVQAAQGASVELVRKVGNGTAIALSTPSGMQTTPTTDRGASIARIAGMTAGAPDVVPLHRLVLDAAERLAATAWPDRHLVLVLGRPINEAPTLQKLAEIAAGADMRLHVIADPGIDTGAAANLAERTGGVASGGRAMLAEVDQVTAAIANRVRVTATLTAPGPHELVLTLDGSRFVTEVDAPGAGGRLVEHPDDVRLVGHTWLRRVRSGAGADHRHGARGPSHAAAAGSTGSGSDRAGLPFWIAVGLMVAGVTALGWLGLSAYRRRRRPTERAPASAPPAVPAALAQPTTLVIERVGAPLPPAPAPRPPSGPAPATGDATADLDDDKQLANGSPSVGRRRPVDRPRRATPRRRPPTDSPLPEPAPEEPVDASDWLVVDRLRLNRRTHEVFSGSRRITLTAAEFAVLELLMTSGGHGVTRTRSTPPPAQGATVGRPLISMDSWPSCAARRASGAGAGACAASARWSTSSASSCRRRTRTDRGRRRRITAATTRPTAARATTASAAATGDGGPSLVASLVGQGGR